MDIITEAKDWIETDHILCADGYEQAEDIIPALLAKLEEKEREVETLRDIKIKNFEAAVNLASKYSELKAENERLKSNYHELIMSVKMKWRNESRHETALRYIKQAETSTDQCSASLHKEKE